MNIIRGFSLIELMITVAVLGIIVAIGYPAYTDQMRKTRRADAKSAIMDAASKMERFYTQFGRYSATIANVGISATSPENFYSIAATVTNPNSQTFTLTATRAGQQAGDKCGNYTINQAQNRSVTGGSLTSQQCW
ncbi:MAG: type IV pilin protein [Gammaproteobacteria bacterium]|nr:type IV pilin protein [Gammaproteobacteria bacterium]